MTITIQLPNVKHIVPRTQLRTMIAIENAKFHMSEQKSRIQDAKYERKIKKSQKKIGPYKPVSYTTIYA